MKQTQAIRSFFLPRQPFPENQRLTAHALSCPEAQAGRSSKIILSGAVMPLARIFTLHPEHANALAQQLESHGYKVEFAPPGADPLTGADLLVNFDVCPHDAALERGLELAEDLHCDIAVDHGFEAEPSAAAAATAAVPAMAEPEPELAEEPSVAAHYSQQESISPAASQHFSSDTEIPVVDSAARSAPEQMISAQSPEALPSQAAPAEDVPQTNGRFANMLAKNAAKALVTARTRAADAWDSARQFGQEYKQKLDLTRAEKSAIRQQRLLELENRKILAQQHARELHAARQSASQRLQELLRERGEAADHAQVSAPTPIPPAVPAPQSNRVLASAGFLRTRLIMLLGRRYSPQTEAIITGVAAVTALFTVGLVLASFHPRAALSNSLDQPTAHANGVTVQTGGVTLRPAAAQPPAAVHPAAAPVAVPPKASPVHRAQNSAENFGSDVTVRNLRPKRAATSSDVTVRHVKAQARPAAVKLQPQDGIKHISDLDN